MSWTCSKDAALQFFFFEKVRFAPCSQLEYSHLPPIQNPSVLAPCGSTWTDFLYLHSPHECSSHFKIPLKLFRLMQGATLAWDASVCININFHSSIVFPRMHRVPSGSDLGRRLGGDRFICPYPLWKTRNHALRLATWPFDSCSPPDVCFTFTPAKAIKHQLGFVSQINKTQDSGGSGVVAREWRFCRFNGTLSPGRWID